MTETEMILQLQQALKNEDYTKAYMIIINMHLHGLRSHIKPIDFYTVRAAIENKCT